MRLSWILQQFSATKILDDLLYSSPKEYSTQTSFSFISFISCLFLVSSTTPGFGLDSHFDFAKDLKLHFHSSTPSFHSLLVPNSSCKENFCSINTPFLAPVSIQSVFAMVMLHNNLCTYCSCYTFVRGHLWLCDSKLPVDRIDTVCLLSLGLGLKKPPLYAHAVLFMAEDRNSKQSHLQLLLRTSTL